MSRTILTNKQPLQHIGAKHGKTFAEKKYNFKNEFSIFLFFRPRAPDSEKIEIDFLCVNCEKLFMSGIFHLPF